MTRRVKLGVLAAVAVAVLLVTWVLVQREPRTGALPGHPAPELVATDLLGRKVDLAHLRGKVVAVNFWATWCAPCREELPQLVEAWQAHHDRCLEIVGVAEESARDDVERMAGGLPYPVVIDPRAEVLGAWGVKGYPHTFVVDAEGRLRKSFRGAITRADLEAVVLPLLPATCSAAAEARKR
jgi:cytochrome c biogenesis protein CcmG, thiol:disulfide interchange protein DsbE